MAVKRAYVCGWDSQAGMWQILSPSGHVLYETSGRAEAAAVCARLNRRFSSKAARGVANHQPVRPRLDARPALARLFGAPAPAFG